MDGLPVYAAALPCPSPPSHVQSGSAAVRTPGLRLQSPSIGLVERERISRAKTEFPRIDAHSAIQFAFGALYNVASASRGQSTCSW